MLRLIFHFQFVAKTGIVGDRRLFVHDGNPKGETILEIVPIRQLTTDKIPWFYRITYSPDYFKKMAPREREIFKVP